jgi:hypothetical protein
MNETYWLIGVFKLTTLQLSREYFCKECYRDFVEDEIVSFLIEKEITWCQSCARHLPVELVSYKKVKLKEEDR